MSYCGPRGIPYAEFLRWDDLSRDAALAWQARENATCGGCGQVRVEWLEPGEDGELVEKVPRPKQVVEVFCPPCESIENARKAREKEHRAGFHLGFAELPTASESDSVESETIRS